MTAPPPLTIGRTGRSDTEGGIDQGPWAIQSGPVHDHAHAVWAMAGIQDRGPRTRRPNGPRRCVWAISMPCALPDHIMRMGQWATLCFSKLASAL